MVDLTPEAPEIEVPPLANLALEIPAIGLIGRLGF